MLPRALNLAQVTGGVVMVNDGEIVVVMGKEKNSGKKEREKGREGGRKEGSGARDYGRE
jgi:hypothetical protein